MGSAREASSCGAVAVLVLVYPAYIGVQTLRNPYAHHDIKPALAYIADNWHDGNVIYANFWSNPLVDYYVNTIDYRGLKDKPCIHGTDLNDQFAIENQLSVFAKDFDRLRGEARGLDCILQEPLWGSRRSPLTSWTAEAFESTSSTVRVRRPIYTT